ncbi:MAG: hypothetical protein JNL38_39420 [Myxococcales bacterium]|nr:hypothetical protein [Myxococcales bacterium]
MTDLRPVPPEATTTRTCSLWVDGPFLRARFLPAARVELADAVENLEVSARLTGGEPHLAIIDLRGLHSQSAEARALFAGPEASRVSRAVALVVGSPLTRMIGNFFLGFNKPKEPTRLCASEREAEEWLQSLPPRP